MLQNLLRLIVHKFPLTQWLSRKCRSLILGKASNTGNERLPIRTDGSLTSKREPLKVSTKILFPFNEERRLKPHHVKSEDSCTTNFLVTSWGHCGSIWFAGSLNLSEKFFTTVGVGHPIPSFSIYGLNKDLKQWSTLPPDLVWKYGLTNAKEDFYSGNCVRPPENFQLIRERKISELPSYVFDEVETVLEALGENYSAVGNVHGTTLDQLERVCTDNPRLFSQRSVVVMDLIRHPVPRTESAIKATMNIHLKSLDPRISKYIADNFKECLELERKYHIDFSEPRARAALHVFRQGLQNDVWAYELAHFPRIQRILMERLQNEPEYFSSIFYILSQGREIADGDFLARVFSEENLVNGRQSRAKEGTKAKGAFEQYERWTTFEREEFSRVAARLKIPEVYLEYGYDFSFLARSTCPSGTWVPGL
jgi:hypothetical protein